MRFPKGKPTSNPRIKAALTIPLRYRPSEIEIVRRRLLAVVVRGTANPVDGGGCESVRGKLKQLADDRESSHLQLVAGI